MIPTDTPTLDPIRTHALADELAALVSPAAGGTSADTASTTAGTRRPTTRRSVILLAAAAVILVVVGVIAFDGGRAPAPAEAMFTATPKGDWIDIAPNLAVTDFDADAAVAELRALGFRAETGTMEVWVGERGDVNHGAPDFGGQPFGMYGFVLADGTEAAIATEAPSDWTFPTSPADPDLIDWEAAAAQLGMRNPLDGFEEGLSFRRDTPLTIYVLTLP